MILYCDLQGNVSSVPSSVPMGTLLEDVVIITPQANVTAVLRVKPAYQTYLPDIICSPVLKENNTVAFSAKLKKSVTGTAGRAEYQVVLKDPAGKTVASYMGSFNVSRGVMVEMPEDAEDLSDYSLEQIYTMLSNVTTVYNQLVNVENLIGMPEETLETTAQTLIGAANELYAWLKKHSDIIGTGEPLIPEDIAEGESGLIGLANANYHRLAEYMKHASVIHEGFDNRIAANVETLAEHKSQLDGHESRIKIAESDIDTLQSDVGSETLSTSAQNLKGAVNETVDIARKARDQAQTNRMNLISVDAQLQGVSRTFVVDTFNGFLNFIKDELFIVLYEDRDGDGEDELYEIYITDLKTGDNLLVVEDKVPDFWFEKTTDISKAESYPYDGEEHSLAAYDYTGNPVGVMHVLETDYAVIQQHATSAGLSAKQAKESAEQAGEYYENTKALAESIYVKQVAPPISLLQTAIVLPSATLAQIIGG